MGAVFFLVLMVISFFIGLGFLGGSIVFFVFSYLKRNKRNTKVTLIIIGTISFIISAVMIFIPTTYIVSIVKINEEIYPEIGEVINEREYQDEEFSVKDEVYVVISHDANIAVDMATPVYTYQMKILFWWCVSGYYYKPNDNTLDFDVYYTIQGDLFCKKEDYLKAKNYFENVEKVWYIDDIEVEKEKGSLLSDIKDLDKSNYISCNYSEISDNMFSIYALSIDTYVYLERYTIVYYNDLYYLYLDNDNSYTSDTVCNLLALPIEITNIFRTEKPYE